MSPLNTILTRLSQLSPGWFRLLLATVVVLYHTSKLVFFGFWAVFVFYVLSGYWIAEMYRKKYSTVERPYFTFVISRFLRVFPTFIACAILAVAVNASGYGDLDTKLVQDPAWLARSMVMLGASATTPRLIETQWSLDIEIQFYLFFPLLYGAIKSYTLYRVVWCVVFLGLPLLLLGWSNSLFAYLPFFAVGIAISELKWSSSERLLKISCLIAALVFLSLLLNSESRHSIFAFGRVDLFGHNMTRVFDVLLALLAIPFISINVRNSDNNLAAHAGNLSYPLYLVHWIAIGPYVAMYGHLTMRDRVPYFVAYITFSLIVSVLIYLLIDRPINSYRRACVSNVRETTVLPLKQS